MVHPCMWFTILLPNINIFFSFTDDVDVEMCDDVWSLYKFSVDGGAMMLSVFIDAMILFGVLFI